MLTVKIKGILNQKIQIEGKFNKKTTIVINVDNRKYYEESSKNFHLEKDLANYSQIDILVNNKLYQTYYQKRSNIILKKLYRVLGFAKVEKLFILMRKAIYFAWHRHHFLIPPATLVQYIKSFFTVLKRGAGNTSNLYVNQIAYIKWFNNQEEVKIHKLKYNPLFSCVIPTYNVTRAFLSECLDSILNQTYQNFEICIADDCSTNQETLDTLKEYAKKDRRIKVVYRDENGHISKATNSAIEISSGEFIVLIDNDDVIDKNALYLFAEALNNDASIDMIYSDEDKMDYSGNLMEPHFKPDFSPDTLMCLNYICHLTAIRKSVLESVGLLRSEFDGSQDYDLFLRISEITDKIYHVRKVLYHWRQSSTSTAGYMGNKTYVKDTSIKALQEALKRRNLKGRVYENPRVNAYLIDYEHNNPLVSIIIPTRDYAKITEVCLKGLYEKTKYQNFEIILVDNGSTEEETFDLFKKYAVHDNFHVLRIDEPFNYSMLNNRASKIAKGEYLLFLNNDTEVIEEDWLDKMVGEASLPKTGCVGIKLLYADKKVQHAGVVLGYGGVAGHIFVSASNHDNGLMGRLVMPYNYSAVTAACLLVKKKIFDEVGGFDENLTVALNDVDFCLKVQELGYYNVNMANITMYHYESKSRGYEVTKEKQERFNREKAYMINKWQDKITTDKYFSNNNF